MENENKKEINELLLGMTKEELPRVSLEGSEAVRRQYLSHIKEATVMIRPDGVQFNNSCIAITVDVNRPGSPRHYSHQRGRCGYHGRLTLKKSIG